MASLNTKYMGLTLKSPVIVASSPLTETIENLKKCEAAGAGAVVLKSIFEEAIEAEANKEVAKNEQYVDYSLYKETYHSQIMAYHVEKYIDLLKEAKKELSIPVIASICCKSLENWLAYTKKFEAAGADAIELNYYPITSDASVKGAETDKAFEEFVTLARKSIKCPLSIKMGRQYSGLANKIKFLDDKGIDGVVLFNRTFRPDVDIKTMKIVYGSSLSSGYEYGNALRWTALMSGEVKMDICANTGIHSGTTAIKMLLAGAKAVEVATVALKEGVGSITKMNEVISSWMDEHNYSSISEFCGVVAQERNQEGYRWERTQFLNVIHGSN